MSKTKFCILIIFTLFLFGNAIYAQWDNREGNKNSEEIKPNDKGIFIIEAEESDTVLTICKRYEIPISDIEDVAKLNGLYFTTPLKKGRKIKIILSSKKFQEKFSVGKIAKLQYRIVRAKLNDTVETLACRHNVSPNEVVELNKPVSSQEDILSRYKSLMSFDNSMPKILTTKSRLVFEQKVRIPIEQNYRCVIQLRS